MNKGLKGKSIEIFKNLEFYKMAELAKARRRWLFEKDSRVSVDPGYIENNNVDKRYEKKYNFNSTRFLCSSKMGLWWYM